MEQQKRLYSLDALRGFDMFWIIGGSTIITSASKCTDRPLLRGIAEHMEHVPWAGFHFMDLIFPMFLFIAGVAIPYSLNSMRGRGLSDIKIQFRLIRRFILLVVFGVIYNGGLKLNGMSNTRFASVLGLIGTGYLVASLAVFHFKVKGQVIICAGIFAAYWAALKLIPVPGYGAGVLTSQGSLASFIDRTFLPGRLHGGSFDPEGILQSISGISLALIGALTGRWLQNRSFTKYRKALGMFCAGLVLIAAAWALSYYLPIIKALWTGSFILLTGGISLVLLSVFYFIIDCLGFTRWAFTFKVIGLNSITIYLLCRIVPFWKVTGFFFGGLAKLSAQPYRQFFLSIAVVLVEWLLLLFLYRKKIFLKL